MDIKLKTGTFLKRWVLLTKQVQIYIAFTFLVAKLNTMHTIASLHTQRTFKHFCKCLSISFEWSCSNINSSITHPDYKIISCQLAGFHIWHYLETEKSATTPQYLIVEFKKDIPTAGASYSSPSKISGAEYARDPQLVVSFFPG